MPITALIVPHTAIEGDIPPIKMVKTYPSSQPESIIVPVLNNKEKPRTEIFELEEPLTITSRK